MNPLPMPYPVVPAEVVARLDEARAETVRLREALDDFRRRADDQAALVRALFELLKETHGLTEAELLDHYRRAAAGRPAPKVCTHCGRPVSLRHERCLYCGADQPAASAFELLR